MSRCCLAWSRAATGFARIALTLNAVVSLTLLNIGTQSPTWVSCSSARMRSALGRASLSNRS